MKASTFKYPLLLLFAAMPLTAKANMIWPSLYITANYYTWYVILIGLIIEFLAIKQFLKVNWRRAALMDVSMNFISALLGLVLIPISGLIVEVLAHPFGGGTFDLSHWILDFLAAVLCNVVIEGAALKYIFKYPLSKTFWWLLGANTLSVIVCVLIPVLQ